jgi:hypothetical protein
MYRGEKWRCSNPGCGAEIVVTGSSQLVQTEGPQCGCGSALIQPSDRPAARSLLLSASDMLNGPLGEKHSPRR